MKQTKAITALLLCLALASCSLVAVAQATLADSFTAVDEDLFAVDEALTTSAALWTIRADLTNLTAHQDAIDDQYIAIYLYDDSNITLAYMEIGFNNTSPSNETYVILGNYTYSEVVYNSSSAELPTSLALKQTNTTLQMYKNGVYIGSMTQTATTNATYLVVAWESIDTDGFTGTIGITVTETTTTIIDTNIVVAIAMLSLVGSCVGGISYSSSSGRRKKK